MRNCKIMENSTGQDRKWKSGFWDSFYAADYIITNRIAGKMAG